MSWQSYVDNQICQHVDCTLAAIANIQDGSIWAKFEKDDKKVCVNFFLLSVNEKGLNRPKIIIIDFQMNFVCVLFWLLKNNNCCCNRHPVVTNLFFFFGDKPTKQPHNKYIHTHIIYRYMLTSHRPIIYDDDDDDDDDEQQTQ